MCVCQRRPGQRVLRIERRRALVVLDRLLGRRRRALVGEVEAAQVLIVRCGHARVSPRQRFEPFRRKTESDLLRDRHAELLLQPEHAGELAVVGPRPHLDLIARTNQLGRDAHPAALGPNRALQQVVGAELAPDLGERLAARLSVADVRPTTLSRSGSTCPSHAMISSVRPSARYSRSGSLPRFSKGNTAIITRTAAPGRSAAHAMTPATPRQPASRCRSRLEPAAARHSGTRRCGFGRRGWAARRAPPRPGR